MSPSRWRAPQEDGATLVVPDWRTLPALIEENQRIVKQSALRLAGRNLVELRQEAFASAQAALAQWYAELGWPVTSLKRPLIVTGHQPELFHPGVLAKNIAVSRLAQTLGGSGFNINVDSDVARSTTLRLPLVTEEADHADFPMSGVRPPIPYEEWRCDDEAVFEAFPESVQSVTSQWPWKPVLPEFWHTAVAARAKTASIPERWIIARHQWEELQQIGNQELTMSRWCGTPFFRWLVEQFVLDHARFAEIYNDELRKYRQEHRIRSANHPVADLMVNGDLVELPFWAWVAGTTQRGRLCARCVQGHIQLIALINGQESPLPQDSALSTQDSGLAAWKIRPKALITSMMFRLFLADLFVHGIGGAVYDELTDRIFQKFWKITLPRFAVVTATLRLPWDRAATSPQEPERIRQTLRRLEWNPDRFVTSGMESTARDLAAQKQGLIGHAAPTEKLAERHQRLETIREQLRPFVAGVTTAEEQKLTATLHQVKQDEHHFSREQAWVLYPHSKLEELVAAVMRAEPRP